MWDFLLFYTASCSLQFSWIVTEFVTWLHGLAVDLKSTMTLQCLLCDNERMTYVYWGMSYFKPSGSVGCSVVCVTCCSFTLRYTNNVCFLLGAQVNAARMHETPLHHAAKNMRVEMIEILVEFGANIYARDQHDRKPIDYTTPGSPAAACLQLYEGRFPLWGLHV